MKLSGESDVETMKGNEISTTDKVLVRSIGSSIGQKESTRNN